MDVRSVFSQHPLIRTSDGKMLPPLESCSPTTPILMLVWPQLGDFDTLEYAWWVKRERAKLAKTNIQVRAVGIGDRTAGEKFCLFTDFPAKDLYVDSSAKLHKSLNLYQGLSASLPGLNPQQAGYLNLLLMCAGIGSPGTLKEVFRGYTGDKSAPQLIGDEEEIKAAPLPVLKGEVFKTAGGKGFQRPFELATLRLRNMGEVLSNWKTYVPDAAYLVQRGGTFLFDGDELVYEWRDRNILGFAENMSNPLSFLDTLLDP